MYCSQLAWLHASFEDKSRSAKVARLFCIRDSGNEPELPDIGCAGYLLGYMQKIGFPMASEGYVKHSEIKCWCETQGIELYPEEHQIIFDSFIEYNSKKAQYEQDQDKPAPFTRLTDAEIQHNKSMLLKARLGGYKGK